MPSPRRAGIIGNSHILLKINLKIWDFKEESANYWIPEEDPNSSFLRRLETCEKPNPEECPFQSCQIGNDTHKSGCPSGYVFDHSQISYSALQRVSLHFIWNRIFKSAKFISIEN